jgi:hypothetical protein
VEVEVEVEGSAAKWKDTQSCGLAPLSMAAPGVGTRLRGFGSVGVTAGAICAADASAARCNRRFGDGLGFSVEGASSLGSGVVSGRAVS